MHLKAARRTLCTGIALWLLVVSAVAQATPRHVNYAQFGVLEFSSRARKTAVHKIMKAGKGNIVTLSDGVSRNKGENGRVPPVLGKSLAEDHPDLRVVLGDMQPNPEASDPANLKRQRIDNTKRLPFKSGSVDLLLMRRGICNCRGAGTCGGINLNLPSMKAFLGEIARVINRDNPEAIAYLAAPLFKGSERLWMQAGEELAQTLPGLQVSLLQLDAETGPMLEQMAPDAYPRARRASPFPFGLQLRFDPSFTR